MPNKRTERTDPISQGPSGDGQGSKKKIYNSSKTIASRSFKNNYFEKIHLSPTELYLQN